tara:strand:+ start:1833 stop:1958 length:126 start_codon:yes stop_codon:yes gene_type:complete
MPEEQAKRERSAVLRELETGSGAGFVFVGLVVLLATIWVEP